MKKLLLLFVISFGLIGSVNAERLLQDDWDFHVSDQEEWGGAGLQYVLDLGTLVEVQVLDSVISFEYDGSKYELPICIGEVSYEVSEVGKCKKSSVQPRIDTIIKAQVFDIFSKVEEVVLFTDFGEGRGTRGGEYQNSWLEFEYEGKIYNVRFSKLKLL